MAVVAYLAYRAVRAGWAVPWPPVGLGVTARELLVVAMAVRLGARGWRRRRRS